MEPSVYITKNFATIDFTCDSKSNKTFYEFSDSEKKNNLTIELIKLSYPKNTVDLLVWNNDSLIINQRLYYIKSQKYSIEYLFDLSYQPLRLDEKIFEYDKPSKHIEKNEEGKIYYTCEKFLNQQEAKKEFKNIKKLGLVSKPYWDSEMHFYDFKCKACNYGWVSVPCTGFVRDCGPIYYEPVEKENGVVRYSISSKKPNNLKYFSYKGNTYVPVEKIEYNQVLWYNESEYINHISKFDSSKYPDFKTLWKETYKKDENSPKGQMWRHNLDKYYLVDNDNVKNKKNFEKVVTLGEHIFPPKRAKMCPVCNDLYEIICKSGYSPLNYFQKRKEQKR